MLLQEVEKTVEPSIRSEEPVSTTSSASSSSVNLGGQKESPFFFSLSPVRPSEQKISERNEAYPNASGTSRNDKNLPPLPKSKSRIIAFNKDNNLYKANHIHRSVVYPRSSESSEIQIIWNI